MKMEANDEDGGRPKTYLSPPSHPTTAEPTIRMAASLACQTQAILAYEGGESAANEFKVMSATP